MTRMDITQDGDRERRSRWLSVGVNDGELRLLREAATASHEPPCRLMRDAGLKLARLLTEAEEVV